MNIPDDLLSRARVAHGNAYAAYSGFKVGACVRADDGSLFAGSNVENICYGLTQCAERSAVTACITAGHKRISEVLIVFDTDEPHSPCGACRQVLFEFCDPNSKIHCCTLDNQCVTHTLKDLLPHAFNAAELEKSL